MFILKLYFTCFKWMHCSSSGVYASLYMQLRIQWCINPWWWMVHRLKHVEWSFRINTWKSASCWTLCTINHNAWSVQYQSHFPVTALRLALSYTLTNYCFCGAQWLRIAWSKGDTRWGASLPINRRETLCFFKKLDGQSPKKEDCVS